jgi:hypothetical protein
LGLDYKRHTALRRYESANADVARLKTPAGPGLARCDLANSYIDHGVSPVWHGDNEPGRRGLTKRAHDAGVGFRDVAAAFKVCAPRDKMEDEVKLRLGDDALRALRRFVVGQKLNPEDDGYVVAAASVLMKYFRRLESWSLS